MLPELLLLTALMLAGVFWADSMAARERANQAAREICSGRGLSLLDETVALAARKLIRPRGGRLTLRRTYTFDYCEDGYSRASGFVVLEGRQVVASGLGPQVKWWL